MYIQKLPVPQSTNKYIFSVKNVVVLVNSVYQAQVTKMHILNIFVCDMAGCEGFPRPLPFLSKPSRPRILSPLIKDDYLNKLE